MAFTGKFTTIDTIPVWDGTKFVSKSIAELGAADIFADYVVMSANPKLANERILSGGLGIGFSDGGPGNPVVISASFVAGTNISIDTVGNSIRINSDANINAGADPAASFILVGNTSSLANERALAVGLGISASDGGPNGFYTLSTQLVSGPGIVLGTQGNAIAISSSLTTFDPNPSYIVLGATASLANERILTPGLGLGYDDSGAGNNLTLSASIVAGTGISVDAVGNSIRVNSTQTTFDPNPSYVVLANTSSLANERVLATGFGLGYSDAGPNASVTISASVVAGPGIVIGAQGNSIAVSSSVTPFDPDPSFLVLGATASLNNERVFTPGLGLGYDDAGAGNNLTLSASVIAGNGVVVDSVGNSIRVAATAVSFDANPSYVVLAPTASLANERVLTPGLGLGYNDAGAGGNITLSASLVAGPGITLGTQGNSIAVSSSLTTFDPNPSYLVLGATASLANERVFTPGLGLGYSDGGSGNSLTLSASIVAGTNVTVDTVGNSIRINAAGGGAQFVEGSPSPRLRTTASLAVGADANFAENLGSNVNFYVSGTVTNLDKAAVFGGQVVVSGNVIVGDSTIASGISKVIVGGSTNAINATSTNGFIGGGSGNTLNSPQAAILAGTTNTITSSDNSVILAGNVNTVSASVRGVIGGGQNNTLGLGSNNSFVAAGLVNTITNSPQSFIGGGSNNGILNAPQGIIVGGQTNSITSSREAFIGAGTSITIQSSDKAVVVGGSTGSIGSSSEAFIGGGLSAQILNSAAAFIIAGQSNRITGSGNAGILGGGTSDIQGSNNSLIMVGSNNQISGSAASIIGGGTTNRILASANGMILNGTSNTVISSSDGAVFAGASSVVSSSVRGVVAGGTSNVLSASNDSYIYGNSNTIIGSNTSIIAGGTTNSMTLNRLSTSTAQAGNVIAGGSNNVLGTFASNMTIAGGQNNKIMAAGETPAGTVGGAGSFIGGGVDNSIFIRTTALANTPAPVIIGGVGNILLTTNWGSGSIIAGGVRNIISGNNASLNAGALKGNTIVGGYDNTVTTNLATLDAASWNGIFGGQNNQITNNSYNTIAGGLQNIISGTDGNANWGRHFIGGGESNTIQTVASGSVIAGGISNYISGTTGAGRGFFSSIGGGRANQILATQQDTFGGVIAGGFGNTLSNVIGGTIVGGITSSVVNANNSFIGSGHGHLIFSALWSAGNGRHFIGGGQENLIQTAGTGSTIVGGIQNVISGTSGAVTHIATNGFIGGGQNNRMLSTFVSSSYNAIVGGFSNFIANGNGSVIVGGLRNTVTMSGNVRDNNFIGGGTDNIIQGSNATVIVGGTGSVITNNWFSSILGGTQNSISASIITATNGRNVIAGGDNNAIRIYGSGSAILGGEGNRIDSGPNNVDTSNGARSVIGGGVANYISGTIANTFGNGIFSGESNAIYNGRSSVIAGGIGNAISGSGAARQGNSILGGSGNDIFNTTFSAIGGGQNNLVVGSATSTVGSVIAGGASNFISSSSGFANTVDYNAVGGGQNNTVSAIANFNINRNTIGGGDNNSIVASARNTNNNVIAGGSNGVLYDTDTSAMVGGSGNQIRGGRWSIVGGGRGNYISGSTASAIDDNVIVGGLNNRITASAAADMNRNGILGGDNNRITSTGTATNENTILGGKDNLIVNATGSHIIGTGNTINGDNNRIILGGPGQFRTRIDSSIDVAYQYVTSTGNTNVSPFTSYFIANVNGNVTGTLPSTTDAKDGMLITFRKSGTGTLLVLTGSGGQTINVTGTDVGGVTLAASSGSGNFIYISSVARWFGV